MIFLVIISIFYIYEISSTELYNIVDSVIPDIRSLRYVYRGTLLMFGVYQKNLRTKSGTCEVYEQKMQIPGQIEQPLAALLKIIQRSCKGFWANAMLTARIYAGAGRRISSGDIDPIMLPWEASAACQCNIFKIPDSHILIPIICPTELQSNGSLHTPNNRKWC